MAAFIGTALSAVRGGRLVFAGLDFRIELGGACHLVGPNGSGKSTLLRLMAGLLPPLDGSIAWEGADSDRRIAWLGHGDGLKATMTAFENVAFAAMLADPTDATDRSRDALVSMGLEELSGTACRYLSAGQRRRTALAAVLASGARLWLLDEPTVGLDHAAVTRLEEAIRRHRAAGGMVVAATHLPIDAADVATLDLARYAVTAAARFEVIA